MPLGICHASSLGRSLVRPRRIGRRTVTLTPAAADTLVGKGADIEGATVNEQGGQAHVGITMADTVDALTQAMAVWDEESYRHSIRTAAYAEAIAREVGLSGEPLELVRIGALLHDIGKMGIAMAVLKKPGALAEDETEHVRQHPGMGEMILGRVLPETVVECAAAHHEQPDGGGYPQGLLEDDIPLTALICRVADVLDSLTSDQTYRPAMSIEQALDELRDGAGTRYSAGIVRALFALVEKSELRLAA